METTITGKNQVTLPARLVRELGWQAGTKLHWKKFDDGSLLATPVPSRGQIAKRAMGLLCADPKIDPVAELSKIREEEDRGL